MVFSSSEFLFLFLPVTLAVYFSARALTPSITVSNIVLLLASWAFYFWGSGPLLGLLIVVTIVNYLGGRLIARALDDGRRT
ncbi:MAG: MBOAT family protein, partial [Deltaproteobacteria bacterium]|nr:MBOAT family protein [Deltaproteobacteria bacterium]